MAVTHEWMDVRKFRACTMQYATVGANPNRISMTTRLSMHIIVDFSLQNKPHDVFAHVDTWYVYILCLLKLGLSLNLQKKTLHWQACKVGTLQGSRIATMFRTMIFVWVPSPSWNISDRFLKAVEKHLRNSYHLIIMPAHWEFDLYTVYINGGVHIAMSIVVIARACHSNIKLALLDCSHGRSFLKLPKLAESELHPFTRRMGNLVTRNGKTVILGGFPNFCNLSMFSISPAHPITRETGIVISAFGRSIWLNTGRLFYHSSKHRID